MDDLTKQEYLQVKVDRIAKRLTQEAESETLSIENVVEVYKMLQNTIENYMSIEKREIAEQKAAQEKLEAEKLNGSMF